MSSAAAGDGPAPILLRFSHAEASFTRYVLSRLFQRLARNSPKLFFRAGDLISTMPQLCGVYEPAIAGLFENLAQNGWGDFLLDIGANIGLSACQNARSFRFVHMFEPNPLCCHILEVNAAISMDASRYAIHPYGLGDRDKTVRLTVPKGNWGGAFIHDGSNSYGTQVLARKDGYASLDPGNYFEVGIVVRDAATELSRVFSDLRSKGLRSGVIKIDVEGYEPVVLQGIARAIPPDMQAMIVLESWDPAFDIGQVLAQFGGRAVAYKLRRVPPWKGNAVRRLKWLFAPRNLRVFSTVEANDGSDWSGDIVLQVRQTAVGRADVAAGCSPAAT